MGPPSITAGIYHLVQGPQLVRVFMRLLSVLMPCLLSVAWPEGVYISVLFRTRHDYAKRVRPVTLSGVRPFHSPRRKLLSSTSEHDRLRYG